MLHVKVSCRFYFVYLRSTQIEWRHWKMSLRNQRLTTSYEISHCRLLTLLIYHPTCVHYFKLGVIACPSDAPLKVSLDLSHFYTYHTPFAASPYKLQALQIRSNHTKSLILHPPPPLRHLQTQPKHPLSDLKIAPSIPPHPHPTTQLQWPSPLPKLPIYTWKK